MPSPTAASPAATVIVKIGEDLAGQVGELVGEGDEVEVDRVEHQLDRHQHGDHVAPRAAMPNRPMVKSRKLSTR